MQNKKDTETLLQRSCTARSGYGATTDAIAQRKHQLRSLLDQRPSLPSGRPPQRGGCGRLLILRPPAIPSTGVTAPYHLQHNKCYEESSLFLQISELDAKSLRHSSQGAVSGSFEQAKPLSKGWWSETIREVGVAQVPPELLAFLKFASHLLPYSVSSKERRNNCCGGVTDAQVKRRHQTGAKRAFGKCSILTGMAAVRCLVGQIDGGKSYSHLIPFQTSQLFQRLFVMTFRSPQVLL